jgi:hypothetical protein
MADIPIQEKRNRNLIPLVLLLIIVVAAIWFILARRNNNATPAGSDTTKTTSVMSGATYASAHFVFSEVRRT